VVVENGVTFLFVRGDCRYWLFGVGTRDVNQATREGVLDPSQEAWLHDRLAFDQWPQLAGTYGKRPLDPILPDVLSDGSNAIRCYAVCALGEADHIRPFFTAIESFLPELYSQAANLRGPVRVMVTDLSQTFPRWTYERVAWSLAIPMSSASIPSNGPVPGRGHGFRVDEPADIDTLRAWRAEQLAQTYHPTWVGGFIPVADQGGPLHGLYVRDVLSIENDDGIVIFEK
jgi:hypothetical protein